MRLAGLFVLTGCSLLVPSSSWHPRAATTNQGERDCPSVGYPIADTVFAVPALTLGAITLVDWQTTRVHTVNSSIDSSVYSTLAIAGLVTGTLWAASAFYGFSKESDCHDELSRSPSTISVHR